MWPVVSYAGRLFSAQSMVPSFSAFSTSLYGTTTGVASSSFTIAIAVSDCCTRMRRPFRSAGFFTTLLAQ